MNCIGKFIVLVLPERLILIFLFIGIIQTILVAFSLKTSRACTGMLSYENNAIKVSKTAKKHKQYVNHVHHSSRARDTVIFLQTSPPLTRNMIAKVAVELYCIFSTISKC